MAKRRKKTKRSRGRRIGAISAGDMQTPLGVAAGALGSKVLVENLATRYPDVKPNIVAAGQLVVGYLMTRAKSPLVKGLGLGMIGNGAIGAAQSFGLVSGVPGIGNANLVTFRAADNGMNGMENVLSGSGEDDSEMQILAGI